MCSFKSYKQKSNSSVITHSIRKVLRGRHRRMSHAASFESPRGGGSYIVGAPSGAAN